MGKGKRLRAARAAARRAEAASYPFVVDERTRDELGPAGLAELALNLWPGDCQTCGWDLGVLRPAVLIRDAVAFVAASLHHERCQRPRWDDGPLWTSSADAALCSYTLRTFVLLTRRGTNPPEETPVVVINPSLETTHLVRDPHGRWTSASIDHHRALGLRTFAHDLNVREALPDARVVLDGDLLTVCLDDTGQSWGFACDDQTLRRVRTRGGIALALTTAIDPTTLDSVEEFFALGTAGRIAAGWVALEGSEQPLPRNTVAPDALRTFVLYHDPGHASVGELLADTDRAISPDRARAWAQPLIPGSPIPWNRIGDAQAWFTLDALTLDHYILRRHDDAWKLVRVFARIDGPRDRDEESLRAWANTAVRTRGGHRVLDWTPQPATDDRSRTLHGLGTAK
ncbi:hypothetical protein ACFZBU_46475 [Embleya sp. NPDC008237]|uniref:hypothetical protein n=1 Tax=Embleya sp. NPDC008237 TaxID=3363978 RepID=UPI0036EA9F99